MTKVRPPVSFEEALVVIKDEVGYDLMAKAIGKEERTIRDYADHDVDTCISLAHACKLEKLYRLAGGKGYPISDCFRLRVNIAEGIRPEEDAQALFEAATAFFKETGEAGVEVVGLLQPGMDSADTVRARRELAQAVAAGTHLLRLIDRQDSAGFARAPP